MTNWLIADLRTRVRFNRLFYTLGLSKIFDKKELVLKKSEIIRFTKREQFMMKLYANSPQEFQYYMYLKNDVQSTDIVLRQMRKTLHNGSVFVDIGANSGIYTLPASILVGKTGKVFSFEPGRAYQRLHNNVELNKMTNVKTYNFALGNRNEEKIFHNTPIDGESSILNMICPTADVPVNVCTLDSILKKKVDMIKIDVEGFEKEVLLGSKDIVRRYKPVIIFEFVYPILYLKNKKYNEVFDLLKDYGYKKFTDLDTGLEVKDYRELNSRFANVCAE